MTVRLNQAGEVDTSMRPRTLSAEIGSANVIFRISDYQSAPPNVYVQNVKGRMYYVGRDRH